MPISLEKTLEKAYNIAEQLTHDKKHITFIFKKGRLVNFAVNNPIKTSPFAAKFGYKYPFIHSEIAAVLKLPFPVNELKKCTFVNVRIGVNGKPLMSRPCKFCTRMLNYFNVTKVYYTNEFGLFEYISLPSK